MYISPDSTVYLLKTPSINKSSTLYFSSATARANYFTTTQVKRADNVSYQRVDSRTLRLSYPIGQVYNCNYMMFKNDAFENKWYYAYILECRYINNNCTEIVYEIDALQSFMSDVEFLPCFVEREHQVNDMIGANITPEPVSVGEYVFKNYESLTNLRSMCVILAIIDDTEHGNVYDGVYGAATLYAYDLSDTQSIQDKISEYIKNPDNIISIYMCPKTLVGDIPSSHILPYGASGFIQTITLAKISESDRLDGYKPVNNKLYTYPYNYLYVDNASGSSLSLRYELFSNLTPVLEVRGVITQPVAVICRPCNYKGMPGSGGTGGNYPLTAESLSLGNYPVCSWAVDSYQAWMAQNSLPIALNNLSNFAGILAAPVSPYSAVKGITGVMQNISQHYQASIASDMTKGNFNNGSINVASGTQQFYVARASITAQYAKVIDDFFTMYGYAQNVVKIPNFTSRPEFNYIKTNGCMITGDVPSLYIEQIRNIFDDGVTFWHNPNNFGNYYLPNKE